MGSERARGACGGRWGQWGLPEQASQMPGGREEGKGKGAFCLPGAGSNGSVAILVISPPVFLVSVECK